MTATMDVQTNETEFADVGERIVNLEVSEQARTVTCRLARGAVDGGGGDYGPVLHEAARMAIDQAVAAYRAELDSLPASAEVQRLERIAAGFRSKLEHAEAAAEALTRKITDAAQIGELAKEDRRRLSDLSDETSGYHHVLGVAEQNLIAARGELAAARPEVAARHRAMANEAAEAAMVKAREAIEGLGELWRILDELAVTVCASQQIAEAIA